MRRFISIVAIIAVCGVCLAQRGEGRRRGRSRGNVDISSDRRGVPDWEVDSEFPEDVFTFVRIRYDSRGGGGRYGWGGWEKWATDYPDSDLNFSFRLQQLTSLKVNPDPIILDLSDKRLFDYPFVYIIEPGHGIGLLPDQAENLRRYCLNGGFVMIDDFWGEDEWEGFYRDLKLAFPDREPEELPLEHPIFHCVYDLKEKPQVPSIGHAMSGYRTERWDAQEAHYRALFDDDGRVMMLICHNTDLGDGWEREGENEEYFHQFSEKYAYPMGINIVFYAMTH